MGNEIKLSKDQFTTLLFLYVANSDFNFADIERSKIYESFDESMVKEVYELYKDKRNFAVDEIYIKYLPLYFSNNVDRHQLFLKLKNLCHVDGRFCEFEKSALNHLIRISEFL